MYSAKQGQTKMNAWRGGHGGGEEKVRDREGDNVKKKMARESEKH